MMGYKLTSELTAGHIIGLIFKQGLGCIIMCYLILYRLNYYFNPSNFLIESNREMLSFSFFFSNKWFENDALSSHLIYRFSKVDFFDIA
jgi:hypothetical protein